MEITVEDFNGFKKLGHGGRMVKTDKGIILIDGISWYKPGEKPGTIQVKPCLRTFNIETSEVKTIDYFELKQSIIEEFDPFIENIKECPLNTEEFDCYKCPYMKHTLCGYKSNNLRYNLLNQLLNNYNSKNYYTLKTLFSPTVVLTHNTYKCIKEKINNDQFIKDLYFNEKQLYTAIMKDFVSIRLENTIVLKDFLFNPLYEERKND